MGSFPPVVVFLLNRKGDAFLERCWVELILHGTCIEVEITCRKNASKAEQRELAIRTLIRVVEQEMYVRRKQFVPTQEGKKHA